MSIVAPHLGGKTSLSQLTQYVQTNLGYRQPFFIFYLVHSSFSIIFPLHLLYLTVTTKDSVTSLIKCLSIAITQHLAPRGSSEFPYSRFTRLIFALTFGLTCPALLWFAAISLASVSDVTAIWNTNAFFAYLISVKVFGLKWEPRRLVAVSLATLGVIAVVYGGSTTSHDHEPIQESISVNVVPKFQPSAPLVGNLLTLIASVGYGLYLVLYKIYAALPSDPELASDDLYERVFANDDYEDVAYDSLSSHTEETTVAPPFGLHPNLLTSFIGLCTLVVLWIPLPILDYFEVEIFRLPADMTTVFAISGIVFTGVISNAGFMVLLGVWGPIIASVGSLLTIVLVFLSDIMFGSGYVTIWSLAGSGVIVAAFAVLAYDMYTRGS
ncbi:hypothetical protein BDQ17DRAFT_1385929 [Cyathus striatus]|nr:hypothetical protein BDQ17DRAFT_1385929 [Cyathus striatus]